MLKGLGALGDMAGMMKKAQEMQTKMTQIQDDLANMTVVGESGAGLVKATATAKGVLTSLDIDPTIFDPNEKEVVEDLILAAIKDAQAKAADRSQLEMEQLQEDMGLPKDMKLPF
ncbi:MAG: YbaB/EbfC family nucleoid-associated protein [Pseudomonadota bacterium]